MKKICFAIGSSLLLLTACESNTANEGSKMSATAQKNLDATHVVNKAFETGDVSGIDSVVASDFVDHTDRGDMGRDSLKAMIKMMHANTKDAKMEIIKELADDEYVFELMRYRGTSDGTMGMPAGPYDMHAMEVVKFKNGKGVEHWAYMEVGEMMKMMSHMQGPEKTMDTTKAMRER